MKHTPPPWKPHHRPGMYGMPDTYEIHWSDDGECVAEIVHGEADANLIAAAPDLLDACEKLLYVCELCQDPTNIKTELEAIKMAVLKAKGQS